MPQARPIIADFSCRRSELDFLSFRVGLVVERVVFNAVRIRIVVFLDGHHVVLKVVTIISEELVASRQGV